MSSNGVTHLFSETTEKPKGPTKTEAKPIALGIAMLLNSHKSDSRSTKQAVVLFTDKAYSSCELSDLSTKLSAKDYVVEVRVEDAKGCVIRLTSGMTLHDRTAMIAYVSCPLCSKPLYPYMDENGAVIAASCACTKEQVMALQPP